MTHVPGNLFDFCLRVGLESSSPEAAMLRTESVLNNGTVRGPSSNTQPPPISTVIVTAMLTCLSVTSKRRNMMACGHISLVLTSTVFTVLPPLNVCGLISSLCNDSYSVRIAVKFFFFDKSLVPLLLKLYELLLKHKRMYRTALKQFYNCKFT